MSSVIRCSLFLACIGIGCGSSSASSEGEPVAAEPASDSAGGETRGEPVAAEPASDSAGGETRGEDVLGRARGTSEHGCEIRRSQADCGGCSATYSSDPLEVRHVTSCTRSVEGVASDCSSLCCHTCPRE